MKIITRILIALTAFACTSVTATDTVYYYHNDHLGTPQVMTDKDQVTKWQADQTPFGLVYNLPISTIENNLRFPGQYYDSESGLHYNYFRDYDPSIGRYTQSDPIGLEGGINTYAYVGGNPVNFTDPTGEAAQGLFGCALGPLGCAAGVILTGATIYAGANAIQNTIQAVESSNSSSDTAHCSTSTHSGGNDPSDEDCAELNKNVQQAKNEVRRLGACRVGMSRHELLIRRQAWLNEAVARAKRDQKCWGGGDAGHQQAQAAAWSQVGQCTSLLN